MDPQSIIDKLMREEHERVEKLKEEKFYRKKFQQEAENEYYSNIDEVSTITLKEFSDYYVDFKMTQLKQKK